MLPNRGHVFGTSACKLTTVWPCVLLAASYRKVIVMKYPEWDIQKLLPFRRLRMYHFNCKPFLKWAAHTHPKPTRVYPSPQTVDQCFTYIKITLCKSSRGVKDAVALVNECQPLQPVAPAPSTRPLHLKKPEEQLTGNKQGANHQRNETNVVLFLAFSACSHAY